jgi:outer membrane protein OmpA-like peptidoglycan-associated protein
MFYKITGSLLFTSIIFSGCAFINDNDDSVGNTKYVHKSSFDDIDNNKTVYISEKDEDNHVYFPINSDVINDTEKNKLNNLIKVLNNTYPNRQIVINGYSDGFGEKLQNSDLSEKRAIAVFQYLKSNNIDEKRILTNHYDNMDSVDCKGDQQCYKLDRRVDILTVINYESKIGKVYDTEMKIGQYGKMF